MIHPKSNKRTLHFEGGFVGKSKKKTNESKHSVGLAVHARQLRENAEHLRQEHQKRSKPVAHAHHRSKNQPLHDPKEKLQQVLDLTRNLNEFIRIYRQAYESVKEGKFNQTTFLRNLEELIDLSGLGMEIKDLVPDKFAPERMLDLLEHAQKHIQKIQPKMALMTQDPSKLTVNLLQDILVVSKRALKDIARDKEKLQKPGKAGKYICSMLARGFSNFGREIIKLAGSSHKEINKAYHDEFIKEAKSAEQILVSGAKDLFGFFSKKAADKVEKAAAKHLDVGSFESKFKAQAQTMKGEEAKIGKHKRKHK